ncbi:hypothetical protein [Polaribacter sp. Asnod6-C07]|uniref:hypothetical protein n=1 Tax=Polaribacter sp. Asnod6-C07 TaxID=3160582 RepID=UPI003864FC1B
MEEFLRKIKLIDNFSISLNTNKNDFVTALRKNVDEDDIDSLFSSAFEIFSQSKNVFKGRANHSGFKIRKRKRFFDRQFGFAKATGNYREKDDKLIVTGQIKSWNNFMYFFFGFAILIYTVFILSFFFNANSFDDGSYIAIPFIIIHAAFMFGIPYFAMRSGLKKLKRDLEREFHFIVSKNNHL